MTPAPRARAVRSFVAERFIRPIQRFVNTEAASGVVLFVAAVAAMAWANSPWKESYADLWASSLHLQTARISVHMDLHEFVNDALMAIFFFVVGLEIKRELLHGELASLRKAALPVTAAIGGMAVPALIYFAINAGGDGAHGWGIPMGTDIAFAMGALALLGTRVPFALKVFVLALAIVDDLGSIGVIAIAYSGGFSFQAIAWGALVVAAIVIVARSGLRSTWLYATLGIVLWLAFFKSGLHATLTGVALAALTPASPELDQDGFETAATGLLESHREAIAGGDAEGAAAAVSEVERLARQTISPLERLEHALHPWTSFLIVPVFALANAGVTLSSGLLHDAAASPVTFGAGLGLLLGKPAGILLASWLAVRTGFAALPEGVTFAHILGAGLVAGIGFTVSLFIAGLAFDSAEMVAEAKIGVLGASLIAGTIGYVYLSVAGKRV